ncbi:hypothetical protein KIPB_007001, partial [Kipferlia bialata]
VHVDNCGLSNEVVSLISTYVNLSSEERQERAEEEREVNEWADMMAADYLEDERLEAERLEAERLEAERLEAERVEAERVEAERQRLHQEWLVSLPPLVDTLLSRIDRLEKLTQGVGEQFRAFSADSLPTLSSLKVSLEAHDASAIPTTVSSITSYTPVAQGLEASLSELTGFLEAHPTPMLKGEDCACLHLTLSTLLTCFTECYEAVSSCTDTFNPEEGVGLLRTASTLLDAVRATYPIPLPLDTTALDLDGRAKYFVAQQYNTVLAEVYRVAQPLIQVAGQIDSCLQFMQGVSPPDMDECTRVKGQASSLLLQLSLLAGNQRDIAALVSWLDDHPPVAQDAIEALTEDRADLEYNCSRTRRHTPQEIQKMKAKMCGIDLELSALLACQSARREKMEKLSRYASFPEAAAVLSAPSSHPLDTHPLLSPFRHMFCDYSLAQFKTEDFPSSGRVPLLSGTHPVTQAPVVLKQYILRDDSQNASVRRELSVFSKVLERASNVVHCHGFVIDGDMCYVVLARYTCDLAQYVSQYQPSTRVKKSILRQALLGLSALSSFGIVHKDIKPQNILINVESGCVTGVALTDFDISKTAQDYIATVSRTMNTGAGTIGYIDHKYSLGYGLPGQSGLRFCHLSDVYSLAKVCVWLFQPMLMMETEPAFASEELSSAEVALVKACMGPKSGRLSAYHLYNKGLFADTTVETVPSEAAGVKYQQCLEKRWIEFHAVKDSAPSVECTVDSLLTHFGPREQKGLEGYAELVNPSGVTHTEGEGEGEETHGNGVALRHLLTLLQGRMSIGSQTTSLFEPLSDTGFPVGPSIDACTIMQEARESGDTATLSAIQSVYYAVGRLLAFMSLEHPLEQGVLGKLVLAGLHRNPNEILKDRTLMAHLFAATFPRQRKTLLTLLENPISVPFNDIPGCQSEKVLDEHNLLSYAAEFETGYVRLLMEGVVEMRAGFNSLHDDWAMVVGRLTLDHFLSLSLSLGAFSAEEYLACFDVEDSILQAAFTAFVHEMLERQDMTLLRRLIVFGTGSPLLPLEPITLTLLDNGAFAALPTAQLCSRTITVPSCCLSRLDVSFQDAFDAAGITLGDGGRSTEQALKTVDEELNRFRILSDNRRTCPSCGVAVEKESGCNHIECHCGKHWCFICGFMADEQGPVYGHMTELHGGFFGQV